MSNLENAPPSSSLSSAAWDLAGDNKAPRDDILPRNKISPRRDEHYYMGTVVFQVEDTLLCLPKAYFLQESPHFRDMFSLSTPEGVGMQDGSSDDQPLRLPEQVTLADFRALAEVLYPRTLEFNRSPSLSRDQWIGVLSLSHLWLMDRCKALAIDALSELLSGDPITKIILARDYHVPAWYHSGICKLVQRQKPLGVEELCRLGAELTLKICALRECLVFKEHEAHYGVWEMRGCRGYAGCDSKVSQRVRQECPLSGP
ncbi:hypothetical protein BD626DRAFT_472738 [Schizophyllum amplum]|uniref:BTB domain-containing protein n=1 Tax=Schizophyllum amplum TaxID=97359 RepID=A0A550CW82_9AGAR|nr:hypothetical protein BD626DRAFT_472738 [Auriculariopsis ampla]